LRKIAIMTALLLSLSACETDQVEPKPDATHSVNGTDVTVSINYHYTVSSSYGVNNEYYVATFELDGIKAHGIGGTVSGALRSATLDWEERMEARDGADDSEPAPVDDRPASSPPGSL
jgi:hypothetical protein